MRIPDWTRRVSLAPRRVPLRPLNVTPDAYGAGAFQGLNAIASKAVTDEVVQGNRAVADKAIGELTAASTQELFGSPDGESLGLSEVTGEAFFDASSEARERFTKQRDAILQRLNGPQRDLAEPRFDDLSRQFEGSVSRFRGPVVRDLNRKSYQAQQDAAILAGVREAADPSLVFIDGSGNLSSAPVDRTIQHIRGSAGGFARDHADHLEIPQAEWVQAEDAKVTRYLGDSLQAILASGDDRTAEKFLERYGDQMDDGAKKTASRLVRESRDLGDIQRADAVLDQFFPIIVSGSEDAAQELAEDIGAEYLPPHQQREQRLRVLKEQAADLGWGPEKIEKALAHQARSIDDKIRQGELRQEETAMQLMAELDELDGDIVALVKAAPEKWDRLSVTQKDRVQARADGYTKAEEDAFLIGVYKRAAQDPKSLGDLDDSLIASHSLDVAKKVFDLKAKAGEPGKGFLSASKVIGNAILDAEKMGTSLTEEDERAFIDEMNDWVERQTEGGGPVPPDSEIEREADSRLAIVFDRTIRADVRARDLTQEQLDELEFGDIPDADVRHIGLSREVQGLLAVPGVDQSTVEAVILDIYRESLGWVP